MSAWMLGSTILGSTVLSTQWGYAAVAGIGLATGDGNGDGQPNNFGDTRGAAIAGPLAGLVIALLAIGTVLLIWNMNKRLKRLPKSFDDDSEQK
ncbi:MAG: hypothetical protein ACRDPW_10280 [Mycobacteriales bacterium]